MTVFKKHDRVVICEERRTNDNEYIVQEYDAVKDCVLVRDPKGTFAGWKLASQFELVPSFGPNGQHKHHAEIKAWADGYEIEVYSRNKEWLLVTTHIWEPSNQYRVKPVDPNEAIINGLQSDIDALQLQIDELRK